MTGLVKIMNHEVTKPTKGEMENFNCARFCASEVNPRSFPRTRRENEGLTPISPIYRKARETSGRTKSNSRPHQSKSVREIGSLSLIFPKPNRHVPKTRDRLSISPASLSCYQLNATNKQGVSTLAALPIEKLPVSPLFFSSHLPHPVASCLCV